MFNNELKYNVSVFAEPVTAQSPICLRITSGRDKLPEDKGNETVDERW